MARFVMVLATTLTLAHTIKVIFRVARVWAKKHAAKTKVISAFSLATAKVFVKRTPHRSACFLATEIARPVMITAQTFHMNHVTDSDRVLKIKGRYRLSLVTRINHVKRIGVLFLKSLVMEMSRVRKTLVR